MSQPTQNVAALNGNAVASLDGGSVQPFISASAEETTPLSASYDWQTLRLPKYEQDEAPARNANAVHNAGLSRIDQAAIWVTERVGSVGFFLFIFAWTVIWTGYNIAATEVPGLHWKSFDPFPAFVAYLLISNVIQILLMPLIMVGQNLQGRHTETRAQLDFEINQKAEKEVLAIMRHLEHNTELLLQLMQHLDCRVSQEEMRTITVEAESAHRIANEVPATRSEENPA